MIIKSKTDSSKMIEELKLNKFSEEIFSRNEINKINKFIKNNPADFYAIRDKTKFGGIFKLKVPTNKIFEEIKEYDLFSINVSSANYVDNQLVVGEIEFLKNGDVYATISLDRKASVRDAINKPDINIKTNIFDKKLNEIPDFDYIYKYISDHNLFDIVVEFALFNIEVGTQNEKIIIYELRSNY